MSLHRILHRTVSRTLQRTLHRTLQRTLKRTLQRAVHGTLQRTVQCTLQRTLHRTMQRTLQRTSWCFLICTKDAHNLLLHMSNNNVVRLHTPCVYKYDDHRQQHDTHTTTHAAHVTATHIATQKRRQHSREPPLPRGKGEFLVLASDVKIADNFLFRGVRATSFY